MKLSEFLKVLGLKANGDEIEADINVTDQNDKKDDADKQADNKKEINVNIISGNQNNNDDTSNNNNKNNEEDKDKQEEHKVDLSKIKFENGKFSGLKTLTDEDADLKALLESVNTYTDNKNAQAAIDNAIKTELGKYTITQGINEDVVIGALNREGIKFENNNVLGVSEAFADLAKNNAGMLKAKAAGDNNGNNNDKKEPAEGPALEGFSKNMNDSNPLSDTDLVNFAFGNE